MTTLRTDMSALTFGRVDERTIVNIVKQKMTIAVRQLCLQVMIFFTNVDPDINLITTGVVNQCKLYDSRKINDCFSDINNISMIHLNIRNSHQKNLNDFLCNIVNLKLKLNFIVLSQ